MTNLKDCYDLSSHPSAILSDGSFAVFVKANQAADAAAQFELEQAGLQYLAETAGVMTPRPIIILPVQSGALFIMQALEETERTPFAWRQIGRTLAQIHHVKSDACGFHMDNYFGPLKQDNTPSSDWVTFYGERRLQPHLRMAVDSGDLPADVASKVEKVINRLPALCGPEVLPSLLHGDAQKNNFISTAHGTYVVDPAVHYGHPELDLAFLDYWQPVPQEVFEGYRDLLPIDPGFPARRALWRLSCDLALVALEGAVYLERLMDDLQDYV
jgi:fructosamine-3-kinase